MHLEHHDVSCVAASTRQTRRNRSLQAAHGLADPWVSSFNSDFNYDFRVSFTKEEMARGKAGPQVRNARRANQEVSGLSVFTRDAAGEISTRIQRSAGGQRNWPAPLCAST